MFQSREVKTAVSLIVILALSVLFFLAQILLSPAGHAVGGFDVRGLFLPWWTFAREAIRVCKLPLWDAHQFGGYPFLSNPQVALFYPPTWLAILPPVHVGISWYVAFHLWLMGVGMLLFVRAMRGNWLGGMLAAVTFSFSGFVSARIGAGHVGLLATFSWLPWLLLATAWSIKRRSAWAGIISGVPLGLAILAGHTTSLLYIGMTWIAFGLYMAFSVRDWRLAARQMALSGALGLALSGVQLLPFLQFSLVSSRASAPDFAFSSAFSFPPAHLITLLVPEFFGEPTRAGYWSVPNFEELTYYAGVIPLLGIVLALRKPSRLTWFYMALMILGILLAFGSYGFLYPLVYKLAPIFRLTRAPGRAALLYTFAVSALLGEAVTNWSRLPVATRREALGKLMRWLLAITAVSGIAALAATGAVFAAQHPADTSGRLWHQLGGWAVAFIFLMAGAGLLWRYLAHDKQRRLVGAALIALVLADLWLFGFKLVRLEPMAPHPMWSDAKSIIGETEARALPWGVSIFDQNGAGPAGLSSVFGYNALEVGANTAFAASIPDPRSTAYDILGAGYVLAYGPLEQYTDGERPLTLMANTDSVWVYQRARTLPIARLVYQVELIEEDARAIARVHEAGFDPALTAVVNQPPTCNLPESGEHSGRAQIIEQRDGFWRIETDSPAPALLVLSETAYPGWRAMIDGEETEIYTAYTAVRAVCVPAGQHEVVWEFAPSVYKIGGLISVIGLLLVGMAFYFLRHHRE